MLTIESKSTFETSRIGNFLGSLLQAGDIVTLNGELGAGKTVLAQGIARGLQINEHVTSPTFTLVKEYRGRIPLYHMDVYRLGSPEEFEDLGYEEYLFGTGVSLIEWAGLVEEYLPEERLDIFIEKHKLNEELRIVNFIAHSKRFTLMIKELKQFVCPGD